MAKSKEELNALKKEVEAVNEKLAELTEEELAQVSGGAAARVPVPTGSTTILRFLPRDLKDTILSSTITKRIREKGKK